ncbi:uncharacterized protein C5orf47 homolog [Struthio camelus]|uniref:uncharacterized protein C5orf47 homolog n=1 Tax=Struthio camelus TaxID=8801 RepID=UPI00360402B0
MEMDKCVPSTKDLKSKPAAGVLLPLEHNNSDKLSGCGGDRREDTADTFDFPFPSRKVDKATKRKKQKSKVWLRVWKVIAKMLEENEKFRSRLLTCSQCNGEGGVHLWLGVARK